MHVSALSPDGHVSPLLSFTLHRGPRHPPRLLGLSASTVLESHLCPVSQLVCILLPVPWSRQGVCFQPTARRRETRALLPIRMFVEKNGLLILSGKFPLRYLAGSSPAKPDFLRTVWQGLLTCRRVNQPSPFISPTVTIRTPKHHLLWSHFPHLPLSRLRCRAIEEILRGGRQVKGTPCGPT
jgi:hypothetical protein